MKNEQKSTLSWVRRHAVAAIPYMILISVCSIVTSIISVLMTLVSKNVIDVATKQMKGSLWTLAIILMMMVVVELLVSSANSFITSKGIAKLIANLREEMFNKIVKKKYSVISAHHSGDLLNRITLDCDEIIGGIVTIIPSLVGIVARIVAGGAALIFLNWRLAIFAIVLGIIMPTIGRLISKKYKSLHKECNRTEGEVKSFIQECFENMAVIKSFSGQNSFSKKLAEHLHINYVFKIKRALMSTLTNFGIYSFFTLGYNVILIWGAFQLAENDITYGMLIAFLQLVSNLMAPFQNISGIVPRYYALLAASERVIDIEKYEDEIAEIEEANIPNEFESLSFNNINFSYDTEKTLTDFNLEVKKGTITAFVGESGSGKSTALKLILSLYDLDSGSIKINGDILLTAAHRELFAYVPQGNLILSGSIKDNLTLYNPNIPKEDIEKVTKAAEIYDYIASLPQGFDTVLSERGAGLSEGQLQRISIARALLTNAPVLLLDEATSALDEETEEKVLSNIKNMKDKTVLFVTHRHTSLNVCDKIVRFESK